MLEILHGSLAKKLLPITTTQVVPYFSSPIAVQGRCFDKQSETTSDDDNRIGKQVGGVRVVRILRKLRQIWRLCDAPAINGSFIRVWQSALG